ncbi:MAG TPA: nucleoside-diphosphate sugar epimerase [Acinetobacter ursingii]|uniref:Nucleoside-diphosphate sugar epimerase n=2 Tax=Gammaproteobacteria TaxID=1236 RepID=A0AA46NVH1_9GAMM|nr:nucleoside-diphosphate sugar epimerase [Acinetobacter ursingii]MCH2005065.1 nucleoside-diphosphate sugar epimerase [Acinetobacter ursingii]MCU4304524.1 nucleoside-diphosphate sugar epimerase [Acinetobacter ursingii]MCU4349921.1 nucleoside-diphosphate sugar epimerase [Acinetobacter ursingii]MCU4370529.1 nucleoside-diphosphate sugar epimerase [Acinetobacter ursingii]MCU4380222.1 nucleoside-diphosphate sugar epimerase [Acinetobacter ursingii]
MTNMNKKALVIGATGLVGKALVKQLQAASEFESVTVVVRKELDEFKVFSKVSQFVLEDFLLLNDQDVSGYTHAFSCLGSTIKKAGSKQKFYAIDYEINAHFADLLQDKETHLLLVSAMGANSSSIFFYNRVKGLLEDYLKTLTLNKLSIFHPSLLIGERDEQRLLEGAAQKIFLLLKDTIKKPLMYKPVTAEQLAHIMIIAANTQMESFKIYDNLAIQTTS